MRDGAENNISAQCIVMLFVLFSFLKFVTFFFYLFFLLSFRCRFHEKSSWRKGTQKNKSKQPSAQSKDTIAFGLQKQFQYLCVN